MLPVISVAEDRARAALADDRRASILYETEEWVGVEDWLTVLSGFLMVVLVVWALLLAYLLFGRVLFEAPRIG